MPLFSQEKQMAKRIIAGFLAVFMLLSASALAEYEQYRLEVPEEDDAVQLWEIFPLDAHNVIVRMYSPDVPWYVNWYRDGEKIRSLVTAGDFDRKTPAEPVISENGLLYMLCRIPSEENAAGAWPAPNATAQWEDSGLTQVTPITERVKATRWDNRIIVYETEEYTRIWYNGEDLFVSPELAGTLATGDCFALEDGVILTRYRDRVNETSGFLCLDHGEVRYRLDDSVRGRDMFPDGKGGFFSSQWDYIEWTDKRNYDPVKLLHVNRDGQQDMTWELLGDRVILTADRSFYDPQAKTLTVYGNAVNTARNILAVFAITLDDEMNTVGLDVRNIDPDYIGCEAKTYLTPDGFPYVYLFDRDHTDRISPAVIPFSLAGQSSDDYGITIRQAQ